MWWRLFRKIDNNFQPSMIFYRVLDTLLSLKSGNGLTGHLIKPSSQLNLYPHLLLSLIRLTSFIWCLNILFVSVSCVLKVCNAEWFYRKVSFVLFFLLTSDSHRVSNVSIENYIMFPLYRTAFVAFQLNWFQLFTVKNFFNVKIS